MAPEDIENLIGNGNKYHITYYVTEVDWNAPTNTVVGKFASMLKRDMTGNYLVVISRTKGRNSLHLYVDRIAGIESINESK